MIANKKIVGGPSLVDEIWPGLVGSAHLKTKKILSKFSNNPIIIESIVDQNNGITAEKLIGGLVHIISPPSVDRNINTSSIQWDDLVSAFSNHFCKEPENMDAVIVYFMNDTGDFINIDGNSISHAITFPMMLVIGDNQTFSLIPMS